MRPQKSARTKNEQLNNIQKSSKTLIHVTTCHDPQILLASASLGSSAKGDVLPGETGEIGA